eukprot:TRINITY_DN8898_c0_g1_i1.p2 TRINITY_DN8898_c0_g1~~TRINITY_DN8898_c0_g1_i1.p2  ORF type:complete len:128 (+),score=5.58 TRINITY_DN8898_c0_g1_i1:141-524(+)
MAAPGAAVVLAGTAAANSTPLSPCISPELLTAVAATLWTTGDRSAWSALSRTCTVAHGACLYAVQVVELPPVPPGLPPRRNQKLPLAGRWRGALDGIPSIWLGYSGVEATVATLTLSAAPSFTMVHK